MIRRILRIPEPLGHRFRDDTGQFWPQAGMGVRQAPEAGFKMLKGTLGLRPNFHQKEPRVDGHIFISVLAYHLLCWIHSRLEAAGDIGL